MIPLSKSLNNNKEIGKWLLQDYGCFQKGVTRRKLLLHGESENHIGGIFFLFFSMGNLRDFLIFHKIVIYAWLHLFENSYKYKLSSELLKLEYVFVKKIKQK